MAIHLRCVASPFNIWVGGSCQSTKTSEEKNFFTKPYDLRGRGRTSLPNHISSHDR